MMSFVALIAVGSSATGATGATGATAGTSSLPFVLLGLWVLLLAVFVGFELIAKVPPTLHTPLMSGSNAISGITVLGALYCVNWDFPVLGKAFGVLAIALATINVVGGFLVTDRMLAMFGTKKKR